MGEELNLADFDILGIITLRDVQGIEKYVTPIMNNGRTEGYLSRSKEYYNVKNMTELALEREELKTKLTNELTKRNFVILENMLNCSGKVYFKKFEEYISKGKSDASAFQLRQAEQCLLEDVKNILVVLQKEGLIHVSPKNILPVGDENSQKRSIEMDNKAMIYVFLESLKLNKDINDVEVLTPGYGAIYIGPFVKAMYGYEFTNMLKSKYIQETNRTIEADTAEELMSSNRVFDEGKTILLLDDNIGTGATMQEVKRKLNESGVRKIISGAVQYNWRNYYRVSTGEKKDIERFEIDDFDLLTPINYAGHNLYSHAIDSLHSSGKEYIEYLNSKRYRLDNISDIEGALYRGVLCARATGLELMPEYETPEDEGYAPKQLLDKYSGKSSEISKPRARRTVEQVIETIEGKCKKAPRQEAEVSRN